MTNAIATKQDFKLATQSLEESVSAMLAENRNPSMIFDFWSFNNVEGEIAKSPEIVSKLTKKLGKAAEGGDQDEINDALKELRKFKRTGLIAIRSQMTIITDGEGDDGMERKVIVFFDPAIGKEIAMKQTALVSTITNFNTQYAKSLEEDGEEVPAFPIQGAAFDIEYLGRPKGKNGRNYDNFDIRLSNIQPNA